MRLSEWVDRHRDEIRQESPDTAAIARLRSAVDREIGDAESVRSDDGKLEHAHAACLAAANAALAACGYRIRHGTLAHHWLCLESLRYTLLLTTEQVKELQDYRRKPSRSMYEQVGAVTRTEAESALGAARRLREKLLRWLGEHHRELV